MTEKIEPKDTGYILDTKEKDEPQLFSEAFNKTRRIDG